MHLLIWEYSVLNKTFNRYDDTIPKVITVKFCTVASNKFWPSTSFFDTIESAETGIPFVNFLEVPIGLPP
jgi:hypothetical protein